MSFIKLCLFTFIVGFATSCNSKGNSRYALRDSIVHNYINLVDTSGQYDTAELSHKVLKAYINNDTSFFKKLQQDIFSRTRARENWNLWNVDVPLPKLQELDIEEGYRFILSLLNTPNYWTATITRKGDSVWFHFALFSKPYGAKTPKVYKQAKKQLSIQQWETLKDKLKVADFWYLKNERPYRGTDGSDLTVIGYRKGDRDNDMPGRYHFVHRFFLSTLNDAQFYVFQNLLDKEYRDW